MLKSPDYKLDKKKRIAQLFESISKWIHSDSLIELVRLFGGNEVTDICLKDDSSYIDWLHEFVSVWDFRKKQVGGGERWNVFDEPFVDKNKTIILRNAEKLGLIKNTNPAFEPDFILPLGGARMANLDRPNMARFVMDKHSWNNKNIVALSGKRPLNEIEYPYIERYASSAHTEFDAINSGLEHAFDISDRYKEEDFDHENINSQASIRAYEDMYMDSCIYSVAAPSSEPEKRRANSYDTFVYFLEKFNVEKGSKLLLVTSSIYVPFQLLKFMGLALEYGLEVDCIGSDSVMEDLKLSKTSNYLQEIKSSIDAIYMLKQTYL